MAAPEQTLADQGEEIVRAILADWRPNDERMTVEDATRTLHVLRGMLMTDGDRPAQLFADQAIRAIEYIEGRLFYG